MEFSRSQRAIDDRNRYKASEFRNLIFYNLVGILYDILDDKFYNHLLLYAVFIRILTNDVLNDQDIKDSHDLILIFVKDFETLYGVDKVTFNLHGHLHLPRQAKLFGPLHKCSGFPFEGMFKHTGEFRNGTRGLIRQTAFGVERDRFVHFVAPFEIKLIKNHVLGSFTHNLTSDNKQNINDDFKNISFVELTSVEQEALVSKIKDVSQKQISVSKHASHNRIGIFLKLN
jgi:hypothetical protein